MSASPGDLTSLDEVREYIAEAYRASGSPSSRWNRGKPLAFGFEWGRLPLGVAEPGPLVERIVELSGAAGITLQELRQILSRLGEDRIARGLAFARQSGRLQESREARRNQAGRPQQQIVLRAIEAA